MFHNDDFDSLFKQMSGSFMNLDDVFEMLKNAGNVSGPVFYGYTMTTGPDGKPVVNEYGNVKPDMLPTQQGKREPLIDTLVDEKEKTLKVVAEMPGVEKSDVSVVVGADKVIHIDAERGEKKYDVKVPIKHKVDPYPPKSTTTNGTRDLLSRLTDENSNGQTENRH